MDLDHSLLIVDDEYDFARGLGIYFSTRNWTTKTATSGQQALEFVQVQPYSAMILDIKMPGMDGFKVLEELQKLGITICVIVLTGKAPATEETVRALRSGAWDYFLKHNYDLDKIELSLQKGLDQIRLKNQLREQREAMAAGARHDLRNPILTAEATCNLLQDFVDQQTDNPFLQQMFLSLNRSIVRARYLIENIIDDFKFEHTGVPLTKSQFTAEELVNDLIKDFGLLAGAKQIILTAGMQHGSSPLNADRNLISRVLTNLVDNAIKYSPDNSQIHIVDSVDNDYHHFAVIDEGAGIPAESRVSIFERYVRLQATSSQTGTGIGLNFCKVIVEAHGGTIWVEDNPAGKGSKFVFTLPLH